MRGNLLRQFLLGQGTTRSDRAILGFSRDIELSDHLKIGYFYAVSTFLKFNCILFVYSYFVSRRLRNTSRILLISSYFFLCKLYDISS